MTSVTGSIARRIGCLTPSSSVLFVCDIQEIFRNRIYEMPSVIQGAKSLLRASRDLKVPIVVTTQYASRLGDTVPELAVKDDAAENTRIFDKTLFSMLTPEVKQHLKDELKPKSVILCGIEGHVCILQTCLDLLEEGYDVHVVSDAVSSSTSFNRTMALDRMRQSGAFITSVESSIFQLCRDAKHPNFKNISKLIKDHLQAENGFDRSHGEFSTQ